MINAMVVIAYLVSMVVLGLYLSRFVKKDDDFFMAGRMLNKWVIAGTIMATNVAAIYLVGPAGAAYSGGGFAVLLIAWTGNMLAAASALIFIPKFRRLRITTVSELLEERYGLWLRLLPALLWIIYYALFSGNAIYVLSLALEPVLGGVSINTIILVAGGSVILYCAFSGLMAVAYTSVIQSFLIILGGLILLPLSLKAVGGVSGFIEKVPSDFFVFWKAGGSPWPDYKAVIMFMLLGLPYWCTSQYLLQRSFAGRSVRDASKGLTLAALMTGPLTLSYIVPGICAVIIFSGDNALAKADSVLPRLLTDILPIGLGGVFLAGLVSASNSTAAALLNSLATLAEHDFYRRFIPNKSSKHYVWVGRIVTILGGCVGLVFAFNVERLGGIIQANFKIMSFFEPPIFVIVAAALFWRYANAWGAAFAIVIGVAFNSLVLLMTSPTLLNIVSEFTGKQWSGWTCFEGWTDADRTIWGFPVCIVALVVGSALSRMITQESEARKQRVDSLLERMRGDKPDWSNRFGHAGVALATISLTAFIGCAFGEQYLPKPGNLFIFMGLMMAFVVGCYMMIPMIVPQDEEEGLPAEATGIETSWVHRIFGNGWAWLCLYVFATALVVVIYCT